MDRLETHINKKDKLTLNKNWEHLPLLKKNRNKNKIKNDSGNKKTLSQNHASVICKQYLTVMHIAKYQKIADQAPDSF